MVAKYRLMDIYLPISIPATVLSISDRRGNTKDVSAAVQVQRTLADFAAELDKLHEPPPFAARDPLVCQSLRRRLRDLQNCLLRTERQSENPEVITKLGARCLRYRGDSYPVLGKTWHYAVGTAEKGEHLKGKIHELATEYDYRVMVKTARECGPLGLTFAKVYVSPVLSCLVLSCLYLASPRPYRRIPCPELTPFFLLVALILVELFLGTFYILFCINL